MEKKRIKAGKLESLEGWRLGRGERGNGRRGEDGRWMRDEKRKDKGVRGKAKSIGLGNLGIEGFWGLRTKGEGRWMKG